MIFWQVLLIIQKNEQKAHLGQSTESFRKQTPAEQQCVRLVIRQTHKMSVTEGEQIQKHESEISFGSTHPKSHFKQDAEKRKGKHTI